MFIIPMAMKMVVLLAALFLYACRVATECYKEVPVPPVNGSETLEELHQEYGDVYQYGSGTFALVILGSYHAMREAFLDKQLAFSGGSTLLNPNQEGLSLVDYSTRYWCRKREAVHIMHSMEKERRIKREVNELIDQFKCKNNERFDPMQMIRTSSGNVFTSLFFNDRNTADSMQAVDSIKTINTYLTAKRKCISITTLTSTPKCIALLSANQSDEITVKTYLSNHINNHVTNGTNGQELDFVDIFLQRHYNMQTNEFEFETNQLLSTIRNLFNGHLAGVTVTLNWVIILLANNKRVQRRAQQEIDRAINHHDPTLRDYHNLHYIRALIAEVQRYKTAVKVTLPHSAKVSDSIVSYNIPVGTQLAGNIHQVHTSSRMWADPQAFRPERFLSEEGKFVNKRGFIPFALGRRSCPGRERALEDLFLFTTMLLQKFTFLPPEEVNKVHEIGIEGFIHIPLPYEIRAMVRENREIK